jgi:hypothetical protein
MATWRQALEVVMTDEDVARLTNAGGWDLSVRVLTVCAADCTTDRGPPTAAAPRAATRHPWLLRAPQ